MKKIAILAALFAIPAVSSAQQLGGINTLVTSVGGIVGLLIPIVFAIALLVFFWGLVMFLANAGEEDARAKGRQLMIWGIIGLFVMASVWGIVAFVGDLFGIDQGQSLNNVPGVGTQR